MFSLILSVFQPDKELARRRVEALRQKVARLNTKAGKAILFTDFGKRRFPGQLLDIVSATTNPAPYHARLVPWEVLSPAFKPQGS
jgi:hypothetical protein